MEETKFLEIVEGICKNSEVYTFNNTFEEVVIFLEAFALGANVGDNSHHSKFTPFQQWLAHKFNDEKFPMIWKEFRVMHSNDQEAIIGLALLYREYVESALLHK